MADGKDPWREHQPAASPDPEPSRNRPWLWLVFIAAVVGIVIAMVRAFPEAVQTPDDWTNIAYGLGMIVLVSAGLARIRRDAIAQHLHYAAIWAGIVAVLALGFAYREELRDVSDHLRIAFSGGSPVATGKQEMVIPRDESGAFVVIAKVNGQRVRFVVDTGATDTVLSPGDAQRIGVNMGGLSYDRVAETANGLGYGAHYAADSLEVGAIRLDDFRMTVNKTPMSTSLLGMSFLDRLESFEVRRGKLILKWQADRLQ